MMGMTQPLLQTKSTDRGQLKEESACTGRGDANNDSGGAERAPLKERATGAARVGATTATVAGGRVSNHSSRASGGSGPADETGQRPEAPAGVGLMINMQRGKIGDSFLEGIGAHDGGYVLSSSFQRQPRVVPPVTKGEKVRFQKLKHEFLFKANMLNKTGHFVRQGTRVVPVGDPLKQKSVLLRDDFSCEEIRGAYQAWNVIDGSL